MMVSSMEPSCASVSRTRTPFVAGSIGGVVGTAILPFIRSTLLPGRLRCRSLIRAPLAKTGTMLVHGSHASPRPSWSLSACDGFASVRQLSSRSHTPSPSLSVARTSAGQLALVPLHCSAGSQTPVEARQMVVAGWKASGGQATAEPSQVSARSHTSATARQTLPARCTASAGQPLLSPSQLSATSQSPAEGRQTAVLLASGGQAALEPVQLSAGSQTPADGRHTVDADWKASAGQAALDPVQLSARSHGPADSRHTVEAEAKVSAGQPFETPSQLSATSQAPAGGRQTAVPLASGGQAALEPLQPSAGSQTPADRRHPGDAGWQASARRGWEEPSQPSA